ncbi:MAG: sulfatase [Eubacterium sp.]|nr:sulfatase [Eubacterium sp.]MCM1304852.1 sulfatase [Butyrivibrio sp.]MCM1345354.1 sulfatase [Muribaculaceae bacterium]
MKVIMVMYDSLCRKMLEPYGCDWIKTPNFTRLAQRAVTFDCNYVGSMPCMPARRELHTGRLNFLHRSWGPLEPFDDSMPEILKNNGIYTHLTTDHAHYWEDGGATYHQRYNSFDLNRGQEGDPWKTSDRLLDFVTSRERRTLENHYDNANRVYMDREERMPQAQTFGAGLEFIEKNHGHDNWFLQIETFDPHEPFFCQPEYKEAFAHEYDGPLKDWPPYYPVTEGPDAVKHMRMEYGALITMCDHYLGKVLDKMDEYNLWEDTMLIVNTDHGFLLGEHNWWSKSVMPLYEEIARTPLFLYVPGTNAGGQHRQALTQTIDLPVTILDFFGVEIPKDMQGKSLLPVVEKDQKVRDYALFGFHDMHCNITDGNWVYMKSPLENKPHYEYTLMPTHMNQRFSVEELKDIALQEPFSFTKGCRTMKIAAKGAMNPPINFGTKLFCLSQDAKQENPLVDYGKEAELANEMIRLMKENDAPAEYYAYLGFDPEKPVTEKQVETLRRAEFEDRIPEQLAELSWERGALNLYFVMARFLPPQLLGKVQETLKAAEDKKVTTAGLLGLIPEVIPQEMQPMIYYFGFMASRAE